jgi:VWFA-related protein
MLSRFVIAILVCAGIESLRAQAPALQPPIFRTNISVVEVSAVVLDSAGRPVGSLGAEDFTILEDGEPRKIVGFKPPATRRPVADPGGRPSAVRPTETIASNEGISEPPIFVLLLDDLNTSPYNAHRAIRAGLGLLKAIPPDALVGIISTSAADGVALTLTRSSPEHVKRVEAFRGQLLLAGPLPRRGTAQTTPSSVFAPCGVGSSVQHSQDCGDTTRAERRARTVEAVAHVLRRAGSTRKVLFWITEDMGVSPLDPERSRRAQRDALRAALNADVAVYPVHPLELRASVFADETDEQPEPDRPDRRAGVTLPLGQGIALATDDLVAVTLDQLARDSGGRWIRNTNDLEKVTADVVTQNLSAYLLAYESPLASIAGAHSIRVRVGRENVRVFARRGYVASAPPAGDTSATGEGSPATVLQQLLQNGIPRGRLAVRLLVTPLLGEDRQGRAVAIVHVDRSSSDGRDVSCAILTIDDRGRAANAQSLRFAHKPGTDVWEAPVNLTLTRGKHQLRAAAITDDGGRSGLVVADVETINPGGQLWLGRPLMLRADGGGVQPTLRRRFSLGEALNVQAEISGRAVADRSVNVSVSLLGTDGSPLRTVEGSVEPGSLKDRGWLRALVPTTGLAAGEYAMVVEARTGRASPMGHVVEVRLETPQ